MTAALFVSFLGVVMMIIVTTYAIAMMRDDDDYMMYIPGVLIIGLGWIGTINLMLVEFGVW